MYKFKDISILCIVCNYNISILLLSASGRIWFPVSDVIALVPIVIRVSTLFGYKRDLKGFLVE